MVLHTKRIFCLFLLIFGILQTKSQDRLPLFVEFVEDDSSADLLTWTDKQGVHFLRMETSEVVGDEASGTRSKWVRIEHRLDTAEEKRLTWSYESGEYDCPVDVQALFRAAPRFSDLNDDGIYELWFIIEKSCKGDISPGLIQILMVDEKGGQYVAEGETFQTFPDGSTYGGAYHAKDFEKLPAKYQHYAREYFQRNNAELFIER